jgi:methionyl-tRNA formyltransferase
MAQEPTTLPDEAKAVTPTGEGLTLAHLRPGTAIYVGDRLGVVCNPGILFPLILQRPGKKRMGVEEFLRGLPPAPKNTDTVDG